MDKAALLSMFMTFVMSNEVVEFDILKSAPLAKPPTFCNGLGCPVFTVISTTKVFISRLICTSS